MNWRGSDTRPVWKRQADTSNFWSGEASGWIDATVRVDKISVLILEQWIAEFKRLTKVNAEIIGGKTPMLGKPEQAKVRAKP